MLARSSQQVGYSFIASLTSVAQYRICTITSGYALMHSYLDLDWWLAFLPTCNGTACILNTNWSTSSSYMSLFTDVSGTLGWGAYWSGNWIQAQWLPNQINRDTAWKELFAIASAVNLGPPVATRKDIGAL